MASAHGATLIWDANGTAAPNPSDGSGNWTATGNWWNGSGNQNWVNGSDAIFGTGSGTAGAYIVTNNSALVQPNTLTFTNPGAYTITTDGVDAGEVSWTAAGGGIGAVAKGLWIGTNITAHIDVPWQDVNGSDIFLGSNSVLTFSQGTYGSQGGINFKGSGAAWSTVNVTNGVFGGTFGAQVTATLDICGTTLNINGAGIFNAGTRLDIGRPATGAPGSDGVVNVGNGGQFNVNANASTDPNANLQISRSGPGTLNLLAGGLASTVVDGSSGKLLLLPDSSSQAGLNVSGGVLNVGTGSWGISGKNSSSLALITLMGGAMSYGGSASAIVNLTGGMVTAEGIQIGSSAGSFASNPTNQVNLSGGTLYLGATNLCLPVNTGSKFAVNLSGGTVAAVANWWPPCSAPINLTNLNGNVTFQAADADGQPFNMAFAAPLTGIGGLQKTGGGLMTLSGANTYLGLTAINGGTVLLTGGGTAAASSGFTLTNGATLTLMNTAAANSANRISNGAAITLSGGAFGFINDGSVASFAETAGTLSNNWGANVVTVFPATNGQSSSLTFGALVNNGGTVDFQTSSAGTAQNRILFTTAPTIGSWLTVNGNPATYNSTYGLHDASTYTDIVALGSTINNSPAANVRIDTGGSGGNIQLGSAAVAINSLQQDATIPAVVNTANETLSLNRITVNAGAQPLAIGGLPGSGVLMAAGAGGNLTLANNGGFAPGLVVNASLADNVLPSALTVLGNGTVTLASVNNSYSGGTTISNGTLVVTAGTTVPMLYTNLGGVLKVMAGAGGGPLPMTGLAMGTNGPQLSFDLGGGNSTTPLINLGGNLELTGDVHVNITNPAPGNSVLLQYSGNRVGTGRFLAGNLPAGAGIVDDPAGKEVSLVYFLGPTVFVPTHDTNGIVVAAATPQQYGAVGDGVTDDSGAFQNALNAVCNTGGAGGGVVYVPSGTYAFSNTITIPLGVTLQGDWTDWSQGTNGVIGTLFKVMVGAGQSNGTPFITMNQSALKGVNIWYPNQNPTDITPYPFTIYINNNDTVVQDVALINSYQGISCVSGPQHIIDTVFGSPLYTGIQVDEEYDISHQENVRFSPDFWPASQLPGAPAAGGPQAAWMRANGVAERLYRCDGETAMNNEISGYNIGYDALESASGTPDTSFYGGYISNCATAFLDAAGGGNTGQEFTDFVLDGDTAVNRNTSNSASTFFHTCQITGHNGTAIHQTGNNSSVMQFQNCNVTGTVKEDGGIANFVNSSITVANGSNHCTMASGAIYAAFTGCFFHPARQISNAADARRLVVDGRRASTNEMPLMTWSEIQSNWLTRRPASLNLYVATAAPYGATGNGTNDDTAAIQSALNGAGANGGGIVYLPPGEYRLTNTLDIPGGVELRGSFPSRHSSSLYDGHVKVTVLQPYGGAGTTNGPPAIALEANAGLVGVTISYELQNTNATPYPPAIQGRGGNVYAYGIMCPNAYWYLDLNSYTCTNHFIYNLDGWAIQNAFVIGNGSSGSVIESHANWSFWIGNTASASQLVSAWQPAIQDYVEHNLNWFLLGDCHEALVKNFAILDHTFMHCISQNSRGPWVNGILTMCDASVECFRFESAASSVINIVDPEWMVTTADYSDLTGYGVISTPSFQGTVRFFNAPLWGGRDWDYVIQGGDVGFELTHSGYLSTYGSQVNGGVAHFVNCGLQGNTSADYTIPLSPAGEGIPGKLSEIIGCYAWTGVTNSGGTANEWGNFGINNLVAQTPFSVVSPALQAVSGNDDLTLTWTNNMGAFNVYATPTLAGPVIWTMVTNAPDLETNNWLLTLPANAAGNWFYRLQQ
jgi:autotransporter-associated beta strand protein